MTVKELIDKLTGYPPTMKVYIDSVENSENLSAYIEVTDVDLCEAESEEEVEVVVVKLT